ncbi:MAG: ATP-binding cassette domain-containing protein, partial [Dehalobacterium sp.]
MAEKILDIKGLKKYFPIKKDVVVKAVDGVDIELYKGETLGLVGESGSGKSTIAYTLVGMYEATDGDMIYKGDNIAKTGLKRTLRQKGEIQIVFQDPGSSLNPRRTIRKSLEVPIKIHEKMSQAQINNRVEELLDAVGLPKDFKDKMPRSIGGGERQLISVARALATNPSLII